MKPISTILILSMSLLLCACNPNEDSVWNDPGFIRIKAISENLILPSSEESCIWIEGDALTVFDVAGKSAEVITNEPSKNIFFSYDWTGNAPSYAVYPLGNITCSPEGLVSGISVPSVQYGFFTNVSKVGVVAGNKSAYRIEPMHNVTGFVRFTLANSDVNYVKIESVSGEQMSGTMSVDFNKLQNGDADFWTLSEDTEAGSSIIVSPVDGSTVLQAGTYTVAVLPKDYAQGLRLTFVSGNIKNEKILSEKGGLSVRNSSVKVLNRPVVIEDLSILGEHTVILDFTTEWPFVEECAAVDNQTNTTGESYTYEYKYFYDGVEMSRTLDFGINYGNLSNDKRYFYDSALCFVSGGGNSTAYIKLPVIENKYLKEVRALHNSGSSKRFNIQKGTAVTTTDNFTTSWIATGTEAVFSFPIKDANGSIKVAAEQGQTYLLRMRDENMKLCKITLIYTDTI